MVLSVFVGSGSQLVFMTLIALGEPCHPKECSHTPLCDMTIPYFSQKEYLTQ